MPKEAIGLPDPEEYGSTEALTPGSIVPLFAQLHAAERAGTHTDVRLGGIKDKLLSWAVRKGLPKPGEKHLAIQQPLHEESYGPWEGEIAEGYGKGKVTSTLQGSALITNATPNSVSFTTAHTRYPERFRLQKTPRGWLLINVTPKDPRDYGKIHYTKVEEDEVEKLFSPQNMVQIKIDGSAAWAEILHDKIESLSYRTSKTTGRPIIHTERVGNPMLRGPAPSGTVLRGELYGTREGKAIPAAELGGLLNASIEKSLEKQREQGIDLRHAVFDVIKYRGRPVNKPYSERLKMLQKLMPSLPEDFSIPEGYTDPEKQRELWERVTAGRHPLSREGIVAHPLAGGKPLKAKTYPESDVYIREIFPGTGKYADAAGGFTYSLTPRGPVVGKVGTGISDEDRRDMMQNPQEWIGRIAKIRAQEQFESGAYRAPAFLARHEDYPHQKAAEEESGRTPTLQEVTRFLTQNPNPDYSRFHAWTEAGKMNTHKAEAKAYALATLAARFLTGGKTGNKKVTTTDVDPKELRMGVKVKQEHTPDPRTGLKGMETKLKSQKEAKAYQPAWPEGSEKIQRFLEEHPGDFPLAQSKKAYEDAVAAAGDKLKIVGMGLDLDPAYKEEQFQQTLKDPRQFLNIANFWRQTPNNPYSWKNPLSKSFNPKAYFGFNKIPSGIQGIVDYMKKDPTWFEKVTQQYYPKPVAPAVVNPVAVPLQKQQSAKAAVLDRVVAVYQMQKQAAEYSAVMAPLPEDIAQRVRQFASRISPEDLAEEGREDFVHTTVKYGLHTRNPLDALERFKEEGPAEAKITRLSLFEGPQYDVLKFGVLSPQLSKWHRKLEDLPNEDKHPVYFPHITVAYLKKGTGQKYLGKTDLDGNRVILDRLHFSAPGQRHVQTQLRAMPKL